MKDPARFLVEARDRIHAFHEGTERWGSRTCRLYTAAVDNTLRELHGRFEGGEDFCLVATGGYARKVLSPYSDVDVLLISATPEDPRLEELGRSVLYPLWDGGLQVGQRPGTVEQIIASAEDDLAARTGLLDLRYVAGSRVIYGALRAAIDEAVVRWRPDLLDAVRHENLARFAKYGESVFLLEPHVKEGKGGLRDFHWLGWVGKLEQGLRGDYDMLLTGRVEPDHYRQLIAAHEFLLRVRVQLHLHFGRAEDRLLFEAQEPVARAMGFRTGRGLLAVEHFMGTYYRHAYAMAHLCGLYIARTLGFYWDEPTDIDTVGSQTVALQLGPSAPVVRDAVSGTMAADGGLFEVTDGTVHCADPQALASDPRKILNLFDFKQAVGGRLHHDTIEDVRAALPRIGKRFREDPAVGEHFRSILEGPSVFRTLAAMHRSGFLGRYIPEFGACFCQAQHNRVHLYTVDVHSLYVVRELEGLGTDSAAREAARFAEAWNARERRAPLLLAGLFHDIAKSHGAAHSRVGADMAGVILRRMGCEQEDIARVQWLVRYHLLLSDTAYHRDMYDPRTMQDLIAVIPSRAHLDDLMALTWADTRATNPALLNSWKQALLEQAYAAVTNALDPAGAPDPQAQADVIRARIVALLGAEVGRKRAEPLADLVMQGESANPGYLERTPAPLLATHAALLDQLAESEDEQAVVSHVRNLPAQGVSQWIVCTRDHPGVFSMLAGAATAAGFNISAADALTRSDGIVIDTFAMTDGLGRVVHDEGRWRRLDRLVGRVFKGEADLQAAVDAAIASARPTPDPGAMALQRVEVTNELSEVATVVEVVTPNRPGLVFAITQVLLEFGLDLRVARIATRQDLAADTFYVVNRRGQPVGKRRRRQLAAVLKERFC
ncbi:MAG: [protein-PII] uridylyltransferase [Proteobacteria bacterium]|nr:[protein-PII] uridylyltransferase [Pseudomonadota bacterium]